LGALATPVRAASLVTEGAAAGWSGQTQTWEFNLYRNGAVRWQNPDSSACTAASAMGMLNLIAYSTEETLPARGTAGPRVDLIWQVDTSYPKQEEILTFERLNMTAGRWVLGSEPHGWRNALNKYGWGSMTAGVYRDAAFGSFDEAAWAVVTSLARTHKPVGILGWYGGHAQFVSGYRVTGGDPRVSDNFTIDGVYLTDPWAPDGIRNQLVTYDTWHKGPDYVRFDRYWQQDWTARDPIDGKVGSSEWHGKYVIEEPTV
jgi:hypothetical protein